MHIESLTRHHHRTGKEGVAICFSEGGISGVEIAWHIRCIFDANCSGQQGVQTFLETLRGYPARGFKMSGHAVGMDPGIGSAGTMQDDVAVADVGKRTLDLFLDCWAVFLFLPTAIIRAVKGYKQLDGSHTNVRATHLYMRLREKRSLFQSAVFCKTAHQVHVLDSLTGCPFDDIVDRRGNNHSIRSAVDR